MSSRKLLEDLKKAFQEQIDKNNYYRNMKDDSDHESSEKIDLDAEKYDSYLEGKIHGFEKAIYIIDSILDTVEEQQCCGGCHCKDD